MLRRSRRRGGGEYFEVDNDEDYAGLVAETDKEEDGEEGNQPTNIAAVRSPGLSLSARISLEASMAAAQGWAPSFEPLLSPVTERDRNWVQSEAETTSPEKLAQSGRWAGVFHQQEEAASLFDESAHPLGSSLRATFDEPSVVEVAAFIRNVARSGSKFFLFLFFLTLVGNTTPLLAKYRPSIFLYKTAKCTNTRIYLQSPTLLSSARSFFFSTGMQHSSCFPISHP
ncbi:hypothetical protein T492DRAFT_268308 [Pavlovales sp. CCMP2436]|nr:hypothetical protein T492DRAFT_268308 [Pavlovales sp. CCMP2436]